MIRLCTTFWKVDEDGTKSLDELNKLCAELLIEAVLLAIAIAIFVI